jgi:hypothetical protein
MCQHALDRLVAPGSAPLGGQGLPEVPLKGPRQAGGPGQPLVGALLGPQIPQKQPQIAALHLLRRQTRRHCMLKVLLYPPL